MAWLKFGQHFQEGCLPCLQQIRFSDWENLLTALSKFTYISSKHSDFFLTTWWQAGRYPILRLVLAVNGKYFVLLLKLALCSIPISIFFNLVHHPSFSFSWVMLKNIYQISSQVTLLKVVLQQGGKVGMTWYSVLL